MTKIKYIHCFGTSFTAGGGFEFNSPVPGLDNILKSNYYYIGEEQTQFNYSYPGQLQKFVGNNITVFNHARQGYGNDRMYRIFYDIINEDEFKKEENLFLFEFAGLGRKEYFLNPLQKYCTINWQHDYSDKHPFIKKALNTKNFAKLKGTSTYYNYENQESWSFLHDNNDFFEKYVEYFVNFDVEFKKLTMESEFFCYYIQNKNFNFLLTRPPTISEYDTTKEIKFGDGTYFSISEDFVEFSYKNKLTIKDETNGRLGDLHNGFKSNKLVSHIIYNRLVDDGYVSLPKNEIDWGWYKDIKFINTKIL